MQMFFYEYNYYFNDYMNKCVRSVPVSVSVPSSIDYSDQFDNSIFRVLFDKYTDQSEIYYLFVNSKSQAGFDTISRIHTVDTISGMYISSIVGENTFNISESDITMCSSLLSYRKTNIIDIDDDIIYDDLDSLGKLIYLYLQYFNTGNIEYINELISISTFEFVYLYLFKWFILNEYMTHVSSVSNIINNDYIEYINQKMIFDYDSSIDIVIHDRVVSSNIFVYVDGDMVSDYDLQLIDTDTEQLLINNTQDGQRIIIDFYKSKV